jgi:hypothetical protein
VTEKELGAFFSKFGEVHDCSFIRKYGSMLDTYMRVSKSKKNMEISEEKAIISAFTTNSI